MLPMLAVQEAGEKHREGKTLLHLKAMHLSDAALPTHAQCKWSHIALALIVSTSSPRSRAG